MVDKGTVYLVGAGPGDQGLISAKGLAYLEQAEVVLYDRLVNPLLLEKTKFDAELVYAGKLPQRHFLRQEAIHDEMVRYAQAGKSVVRLKGGDPGVFGRVGEEAAFLEEYNIPYEIVPGITAGIAAPAYTGIPVTHRLYGTSFAVAAGHRKGKDELELDWEALSKLDTIAFYMGVKNLPTIVENLIQNGRSESEPVLVIQWGTTTKQKTVKAELGTIVATVEHEKLSNPAITLVGEIASQYTGKSWFENKPLFGSSPLLLNDELSENVAKQLEAEGAEPFLYPRWHKTMLPLPQIEFDHYGEVAFQDAEDVTVFFKWLEEQEIDIRQLQAIFTAKTERAKAALHNYGIRPQAQSNAEAKLLLANDARFCEEGYAYQQTVLKTKVNSSKIVLNRLLEEEKLTEIIVPSVAACELLLELYSDYPALRKLNLLALSPDVKQRLISLHLPFSESANTNAWPMTNWLNQWFEGQVDAVAGDFVHRSRQSSGTGEQAVSAVY